MTDDARKPPEQPAFIPGYDEGLDNLRSRLDALQSSVERLGTEGEAQAPPAHHEPPAATNGQTEPDREIITASSATIAILDAGPFGDLIELRRFEEELASMEAVRYVHVRRFGHRRAQIEVGISGPHTLGRELYRLGRPLQVEPGPGGRVVVHFADAPERDDESSRPTGIPTVPLEPDPNLPTGDPVDAVAAQLLPEQVCRHFRMIPIGFDGSALTLAMFDPSDPMAQDVAYALTGAPLNPVLAPPSQIDRAIDRIYGGLGHYEPPEGETDERAAP